MKISEVFRKRALFGVAVFCITAIATVGVLSTGENEEDNTPNNLVDLNAASDPGNTQMADGGGQTKDKTENPSVQVGESIGNADDVQTGDKTGTTGVQVGNSTENQGVQVSDNSGNLGTQVGDNTQNADVQLGDNTENADTQAGDSASGQDMQVSDNTGNSEMQDSGIQVGENTEDQTEVLSPAVLAEQLNFDKSAGLLWPISGQVIIPYSPEHGVFYQTLDQFAVSEAVVLSSAVGTEVKAAAKGVITSIEEDVRTGTTVTLALGNNTSLVYGQLDISDLKEGDVLEAGECIGTVAEPTRYYVMEGPNLYFKVMEGETSIDPTELLKEEQVQ